MCLQPFQGAELLFRTYWPRFDLHFGMCMAMRTHPPPPPSRCFTLALIIACLASAIALSSPPGPASTSPSAGVLSGGTRPLQGERGILRLRGGATDATAKVRQDPCRSDHLFIDDLGNGCRHRNFSWDMKRSPLHHRHKHDRIPPQSNTIPGRRTRRPTPSPRKTRFPRRRATSSPPLSRRLPPRRSAACYARSSGRASGG